MKHDGDNWVFASGQRRYAHSELLSIEQDEFGYWNICYGSDGSLWSSDEVKYSSISPLSTADLLEVADHQIAKWREFRQSLISDSAKPAVPSPELLRQWASSSDNPTCWGLAELADYIEALERKAAGVTHE